MASAQDDLKAISETARDLAYKQLEMLIKAIDSFDTKALGVLAFDGAALGAVLAARGLVFPHRWEWVAIGLILSSVAAALCIWTRSWNLGPEPRKFYDRLTASGVALGDATAANIVLVSQLGGDNGAIAQNRAAMIWKSWFFGASLGFTGATGVLSALLVGRAI